MPVVLTFESNFCINYILIIATSIYGPNFTSESMNGDVVSSEPKTFSSRGSINRHGIGTIIPLINVSNNISLILFWMPSYYQPLFEFSVEPRQQLPFIDTCFIFAKES